MLHNRLLGCGTNSSVFTHTDLQIHRRFSSLSLTVLYLQSKFAASCKNIKTEQELLFHFIPSPLLIAGSDLHIKFDKREQKQKVQNHEDFLQGSLVSVCIQCGEAETVQECTQKKKEKWMFEVENTEVKGLFKGVKWRV